jgi:tRNA nucleotidyltransferase (CCA-adding enzyme)
MKSIVSSGELTHLVAERVWKETDRALCEQSPDLFIQTLRDCGALAALLPEVNNLFGVAQRADYHPEIDTGIHTLMALQQAAILSDKPAIRFAVLVHDLGKGITPDHILPSHSGHEARGLPLVKAVCDRLKAPNEHRQLAMTVTEFHLLCHKARELQPDTLLSLLKTVGALKSSTKLEDFLTCCTADAKGRIGFENRDYSSTPYLRAATKALQGIDISGIVNSGISGAEIGEQLALRQTDILQQLKDNYQL